MIDWNTLNHVSEYTDHTKTNKTNERNGKLTMKNDGDTHTPHTTHKPMGNEHSGDASTSLRKKNATEDQTYSLKWFKLRENSTQLDLPLLKKAFNHGYRKLCPYTLFLTLIEEGDYESALQVIYLSDMTHLTEDALHELMVALVVSVEACTDSTTPFHPPSITGPNNDTHPWTHKKVYAFLNLWEYLYHCHGTQDFMDDCDMRGMCKVLRNVEQELDESIVRFLNIR